MKRTPTETLMHCLEDFGNDEPLEVMVIYTTQNGDVAWSSTTDHLTVKIGMLEFVRQRLFRQCGESDD